MLDCLILPPDIVEFRNCTMVECPPKLATGADLILSLSIYIKPSAFRPPKVTPEDGSKVIFNEGHETEAEQILRERKKSLISLFKRIGLKPHKSSGKTGGKLSQQELELLTQVPKPTQTKTSSSNGEDDDGEGDISEEQINLIFKKYAYSLLTDTLVNVLSSFEEHSRMIINWGRWSPLTRSRSSFVGTKSKPCCTSWT